MTNQLDYNPKTNEIIISFDYDAKLVDKARSLQTRRFDGPSKSWIVPFTLYEDVVQAFYGFLITPNLRQNIELAQQDRDARKATDAIIANRVQGYSVETLPNGRTLYKHQVQGYKWLIEHNKGILAFEMGTGKTLTALVAAKAYQMPVIVLAPASLLINWKREADIVGLEIDVFSWAKVPTPYIQDFVLIADECHYAMTLKSQRTSAFLALAESKHCKGCFLLSGTPIKNGRPVNLYPLLKALNHPLSSNKAYYEKRYCNAHQENYGSKRIWKVDGASNLKELHDRLQDVMLRKTKAECLDLPEKIRVQRKAELSKEAIKTYNTKFSELRKGYLERVQSGEIMSGSEAVVMLNYLRQAASSAKIESSLEIARDVIEEGNQVVLFTAFLDTGRKLAEQLGCKFLSGDKTTQERQDMIDEFQAGKSKALVATYQAGGIGITLTAAQVAILVDRIFVPGDIEQSEDRLHRIGQQSAVTIYWLQYGNTDSIIDALLNSKADNIEIVLSGKKRSMKFSPNIETLAKDVLVAVFDVPDMSELEALKSATLDFEI